MHDGIFRHKSWCLESKEIVKEVKNSRGTIIAAIIGLVSASLILDHLVKNFKECR